MISREEERELVLKAQAGDLDARNALVVAHLPLIRMLVRKGVPSAGMIDEYLSVGVEQFISGIDSYDPERPSRLTTYAGAFIPHQVRRAAASMRGVIHVPVYAYALKGKPEHRHAANRAKRAVSLNTEHHNPSGHDGSGSEWALQIPDHRESGSGVEDGDDLALIRECASGLRPRSRMVLLARAEGRTLEDIGEELGITRERVRQIERRAVQDIQRRIRGRRTLARL